MNGGNTELIQSYSSAQICRSPVCAAWLYNLAIFVDICSLLGDSCFCLCTQLLRIPAGLILLFTLISRPSISSLVKSFIGDAPAFSVSCNRLNNDLQIVQFDCTMCRLAAPSSDCANRQIARNIMFIKTTVSRTWVSCWFLSVWYVCVRACVRAWVRACVRARVCVCVCVRVPACLVAWDIC